MIFALFIAAAPLLTPAAANPLTALKAGVVLKVSNRDAAASALIAKSSELGGYFANASDNTLVLRVPAANAKPLLAFAATLGVVADRQFDSEDVGFELAKDRGLLISRQQLLKRYLQALQSAEMGQVATVERETVHLVEQIEQLKGGILQTEQRVSYATVRIDFQFREREAPSRDGRSSFAWLNTLNLSDLLADFNEEHD